MHSQLVAKKKKKKKKTQPQPTIMSKRLWTLLHFWGVSQFTAQTHPLQSPQKQMLGAEFFLSFNVV